MEITERNETRGLWFGLLGVTIFAMTLSMTRLAVGPASDPQLPPVFVTAGRAAFAGILSVLYLYFTGAPRLHRRHLPALFASALGTVVGFPLFLSLALREVDAMHAAVVTGLMPLTTAIGAALYFRQRPSNGFWACALLGSAMVVAFAAYQGGGSLSAADGLLLLAVLSTSVGYVAGARVAAELPAQQVICWVLVISLPFTAPIMLATWPAFPVRASAWGGLPMSPCFRCGWDSLRGITGWHWGAPCASVKCNSCNHSWPCFLLCQCWGRSLNLPPCSFRWP